MLKDVAKPKREMAFMALTFIILSVLIVAVVWGFSFLVMKSGSALEDPGVKDSDVLKFNLAEFESLKLGN